MTASVEAVWSRGFSSPPLRRSGTLQIDNGESLSETFPLYGASAVAITVPTITSASLSFQVQAEPGGDFFDLYDAAGDEVALASGTGGFAQPIPGLSGWFAFKVRSGLSGADVTQEDDRVFQVQVFDE